MLSTGQDGTGQGEIGQEGTGQDMTEKDRTGQGWTGLEKNVKYSKQLKWPI